MSDELEIIAEDDYWIFAYGNRLGEAIAQCSIAIKPDDPASLIQSMRSR